MDLKLRVLGTLLVVAASGCVETPVDKNSANLGKFDEGNPCPLDAVTQMIPDPERPVHRTGANRDYRGWTNIVGTMKPVGNRDWVTFSMILKPGVPPWDGENILSCGKSCFGLWGGMRVGFGSARLG